MQRYESFGDCLKRCLKEGDLSASEAARLVGFRSRNSIFRILSGDAGYEIKLSFLESLHKEIGAAWPEERWRALQEALSVERLGPERYLANQAFERVLCAREEEIPAYTVHQIRADGTMTQYALSDLLRESIKAAKVEIVLTGCCENGLSRLLADCCSEAGARGTLSIRHYIDVAENVVTQNILGVLPLISKPWYNARLVEPDSCPPEMMAVYRIHSMDIHRWDENGEQTVQAFIRFDKTNFVFHSWMKGTSSMSFLTDRWRFQLDMLKPVPQPSDGPETFVQYTEQYRQMEDNCTILSIKPDPHFNCIPANLLEQAVVEGFEQSGMVAGPELAALIETLKAVHIRRFDNMMKKHRPTHLVYSLPDMERFMRTGVLTDQFFIQRAYTVEERRQIIRVLLEAMRSQPYFNVHILKPDAPELRYEITFYDGKGVLLMDAYTGYDLDRDHSEAFITLPAFMESFRRYFIDELLARYVLSRAETIRALEALLVMKIQK